MTIAEITYIVLALAQCAYALKWLYKRIRTAEVQSKFTEDMATNHLPHIYHVLTLLCQKEGIVVGDPPPIQFVRFKNGSGKDTVV